MDRYQRQMLLGGIGKEGQQKLGQARVLVAGCGALGGMIANMLCRAGVGELVVVDRDYVEETNLQRQVLFDEADARDSLPKAVAAKRKLEVINSTVLVQAVVADINHENVEDIMSGDWPDCEGREIDLIVDGLDNFETRYLLNDVAVMMGKPYVYAGAVATSGTGYVVLPRTESGKSAWEEVREEGPCVRCIQSDMPAPGSMPTCDTAGVLGPMVGLMANWQCAEVIKILTGNWFAVNRKMLHVDVWSNRIGQIDVSALAGEDDCVCCGEREFEFLDGKFGSRTTSLCGRDAVQVYPGGKRGAIKIDFEQISKRLSDVSDVSSNGFMLRTKLQEQGKGYELIVFADGRALVKGTTDAAEAKGIYAKYLGA